MSFKPKKYIRIIIAAVMAVLLSVPCINIAAAEESGASDFVMFDDLADFSVSTAHSEGLAIDIVTDENKYAFSGDDTHLIRVTSDAEQIEYDVPQNGYLVFHTAYAPNEAISHFTFEYSSDGENYKKFNPIITEDSVSGKWIPVHYNLKKLPEEAAKLRVTFGNVGGTPWSPCIESVELKSRVTDDIGFADCVGTEFYGSTAKLKNLGLISGYSETEFGPEGTITRAEFSAMVSRLLALSETVDPSGYKKVFSDVTPDYWGAGAIYALYSLGVVNGDENGKFNPEDNITLRDALKIMVSSLGYTASALDRGGYPEGFLREASRLSLLIGLGDDYEKPLIRGEAAKLMDNALDVPVVAQNTYGGNNVYSYGGETILGRYHDIVTRVGEVTDVGGAGVYAESNTSGSRFMIGGEIYDLGGFDMLPYLGMRGTVYLKNNGGNYTAVYFENGNGTTVTDIDYNDFDRFENGAIYFEADGSDRRAPIGGDAKIIYNYQYLTRASLLDDGKLPFKCGYMKLISNSGGSADYVLIYDFDTYIPSGSARLGGVISDKNIGAVNLRLDEAEKIMLSRDGEKIEYDPDFMLSRGQVVNVAKSPDGKIADIRISLDTAVGEVSMVNRAENEYIVGGESYALSEYFKNSGRELSAAGGEITAYLDINGNIADTSESASAMRYGYLKSVDLSGDSFSNAVLLQVVTESGKAETLNAKGSSILNGERFALDKFAELKPQLVKFTAKTDGSIGELQTADDVNGVPETGRFARNYVSESAKYYDGLNVFASKYQLDSSTKVFTVPSDVSDITKYRVGGRSELLSDTAYNVQIFDLSDEYKAGAVVIKSADDSGSVYNYSPVCVIESAGKFIAEDGTEQLSLSAYVNGEKREIRFSSEGAADRTGSWIAGYTERSAKNGENPFSAGEVMQFSERDGVCSAFRMLLTRDVIEQGAHYEKNLGDYGPLSAEQYYSELYTAFGTVEHKFADKFLLSAGGENILRTVPAAGAVYIYNKNSRRLYVGDASDIEQGCEAFTQMRLGATNLTVVMR